MNTAVVADATPPRHSVTFTASGSEYFRIWIVNLLLILVTLGIYLPWAKVRKLKYFYGNTWVAGDALEFHGRPLKMLRGTVLAGGLLIAFSLGMNVSGWATLLAAIAVAALGPALFRAATRFRMANTSWRGLRFRFTGDMRGAYACLLPPLMLAMLPAAITGVLAASTVQDGSTNDAWSGPAAAAASFVGVGMLGLFAALPYFLWRLKRYQHDNYAIGGQRVRLEADVGVVYGIFIKLVAVSLAGMVIVGLLFAGLLFGASRAGNAWFIVASIAVGSIGVTLFNILPKAFLQVRLQNLLWSGTGNRQLQFRSELRLADFFRLQCKNFVLILATLGLYWPFAVVHTRRARLEAVELRTRIDLDTLSQTAGREDPGATGDMAVDFFGMDVGL